MKKRLLRIAYDMTLLIGGFLIAGLLFSNVQWPEISLAAEEYTPVANAPKPDVTGKSADSPIAALNNTFVNIADRVTPSVVTIKTKRVIKQPQMPAPMRQFFDDFFEQRDMRNTVLGSGVIVKENGYILTNNHVVARGEEITVKLNNGKEYQAEEVLTDSRTDIAVIKIDAEGLDAIEIGDSSELRVGEWVLALGNPFDENLQHSVTAGIVSAKGRTDVFSRRQAGDLIQNFIQTDAAINPGNSGGALVNLYGQLVGINTAIASRSGGNQGIGFAVPINMATDVMNDLIQHGKVVRGYLGVYMQPVDNEIAKAMGLDRPHGAMVNKVAEGSPAAEAGLKVKDLITAVDGDPIQNPGNLQSRITQMDPGEQHKLTVIRDGEKKTLAVTIDEVPEDMEQQQASAQAAKNFGMTLRNVTPELADKFDLPVQTGVLVAEVQRGSQAAEKNIRQGDIVTHVGRQHPVKTVADFKQALREYDPGDSIILRLMRGDNLFFVGLTIPTQE
ncbi:MAG: DegQ family serine endoprotease [Candidatus Marinimicrobia bacterium]|nr:DegQ family serine endoprotease [Candidatus Neomarinimicrobiota bacterium]MCF7830266.1 DegQ family serine endoprotease [Candidatus Neomarinimicrobiota bacterium]MCF7882175.1 DegQ family serine endoprotease [Candidatus Neomarinimicrobiota bacterium]